MHLPLPKAQRQLYVLPASEGWEVAVGDGVEVDGDGVGAEEEGLVELGGEDGGLPGEGVRRSIWREGWERGLRRGSSGNVANRLIHCAKELANNRR